MSPHPTTTDDDFAARLAVHNRERTLPEGLTIPAEGIQPNDEWIEGRHRVRMVEQLACPIPKVIRLHVEVIASGQKSILDLYRVNRRTILNRAIAGAAK